MIVKIAVIDYGMGNQGSIVNALRLMDYKVSLVKRPEQINDKDLIVLPGVGAFPQAMENLNKSGFTDYLLQLNNSKPLIGICLGMQLLAESSLELKETLGLGIIPGKIQKIGNSKWHIGWNRIKIKNKYKSLKEFNNKDFYFNHSFKYVGNSRYEVARSGEPYSCSAIIKKGLVYGLQFHPEKSQQAGRSLIAKIINGALGA
ncbi:MAG: imidazole glycerol phosphate synthase subunit HisH [Rickettsiales bacterium]|nr:imidazole glycerol phosphate synthase subunit HisH [Rickettsiales bacterium]|tara:strand:+ start:1904 stop:2509 length:606 start_codon:yes stop_codon:yes gene_type:complete